MPLEKDVRAAINARVEQLKRRHPIWIEAITGHPGQRSGLPDLRIVFYGLSLDVETKRDETKQATPAQAACIREIRKASGAAIVAHSVEQVDDELRRLLMLAQCFSYCGQCHAPNVDAPTNPVHDCRRCGAPGPWHLAKETL